MKSSIREFTGDFWDMARKAREELVNFVQNDTRSTKELAHYGVYVDAPFSLVSHGLIKFYSSSSKVRVATNGMGVVVAECD